MNLIKNIFLMQTVLLCGGIQQALAAGCNTPSTPKHMLMVAYASEIKMSGSISKYQEIGRFNFQKEAPGISYVASCEPGSTAYAYAGQGSPTERGSNSMGMIDGYPAFSLPRSYSGGEWHYAYVLIDDETGKPYGDKNSPSELYVNDGEFQDNKLRPRSATVILYAGIDNPTAKVSLANIELGGLLPGPPGKPFGVGVTYKFNSGNIAPVSRSCSLENANNLIIDLPHSPISALPEIGSTHAKGKTELIVKCTGDMRATMTLNLDNNQVLPDESGDDSVIRNKKENDSNGAKGIGFVVSTNEGTRLANHTSVFLKDLGDGTSYVPIYAEYYRYGNEVSAGKVEAIANFVIEFK